MIVPALTAFYRPLLAFFRPTFMAPKYFTLDQANKTLPLVRRVVSDIVDEYRCWKDLVFRYELLAAGSKAEEGESGDQVALREQVDESARKITAFQAELTRIGCMFKGLEEGLVDFYHQMDGRDVLLCWRLGEERVAHWHEVEDGFAGRQPIGGQDGHDGQDGRVY